MQTFTLTLYGASVSDVQRLLTEAGLTGLSFDVAWGHDEPDEDIAAASPPPTDTLVYHEEPYPFEGYETDFSSFAKSAKASYEEAKRNHPTRGGL